MIEKKIEFPSVIKVYIDVFHGTTRTKELAFNYFAAKLPVSALHYANCFAVNSMFLHNIALSVPRPEVKTCTYLIITKGTQGVLRSTGTHI